MSWWDPVIANVGGMALVYTVLLVLLAFYAPLPLRNGDSQRRHALRKAHRAAVTNGARTRAAREFGRWSTSEWQV